MNKKRALESIWLSSLVIGVGLMIPFDMTLPRIVGMASLFAFIVIGVFLLADPNDL